MSCSMCDVIFTVLPLSSPAFNCVSHSSANISTWHQVLWEGDVNCIVGLKFSFSVGSLNFDSPQQQFKITITITNL